MRRLLFGIFLIFWMGSSVSAQTPWADSTALEAYMDGLVHTYMQENDIAGATVGIIKDGQPALLKGYGYADVKNEQPVNPDSTLFRIGSISKMFVWTAIMQLKEEGKLELDADINRYLEDVKIPDTYDDPITLRDLMTHSAGFEEYIIGLFARDSTRLRPLGEILAEELPARVRPPATYSSYSNHGTGIAAYIVEQVSGMEFEDYVEERIFDPLDMNQSTFRQPLPKRLKSQMSKGYAFEEGEFKEKEFEFVPLGPVGTASTTAENMLHFMQTHLRYGQYQDTTILNSSTGRLMQQPAFRQAKQVNPMRYGFIDQSQNGVEIIGHGGDTFWFHSTMMLFPEHDLGFFLSFNSANGGGTYGRLFSDFVDHYFPEDNVTIDTLQMGQEQLQRFTGSYRANRYPHERFTHIIALLGSSEVTATEDGTLKTMDDGEANYWFPVDSLTFQNTQNTSIIAFDENEQGKITHMLRGELPIFAFEKISFVSSQTLHFTLFGLAGAVFLATLFYWPLAYGVRKNYRLKASANASLPFVRKATAWVNALIILVFFGWVGLGVGSNGEGIIYGLSAGLKTAFILPIISVLLMLAMGYHTYKIWQNSESRIWSRLWYSLLFVLSGTLIWQLYYWNLLGFQF